MYLSLALPLPLSFSLFLMVRSCFLITLKKCLKGRKSLGSLCNVKSKSEWVTQWQGHLLSCSGQLKRQIGVVPFKKLFHFDCWTHSEYSEGNAWNYVHGSDHFTQAPSSASNVTSTNIKQIKTGKWLLRYNNLWKLWQLDSSKLGSTQKQ